MGATGKGKAEEEGHRNGGQWLCALCLIALHLQEAPGDGRHSFFFFSGLNERPLPKARSLAKHSVDIVGNAAAFLL